MGVKRRFWTDLWYLLVYTFLGALLTVGGMFLAMSAPIGLEWQLHLSQWAQNALMFVVPTILWVKLYKKEPVCESLRLGGCSWLMMAQVTLLMLVSVPLMDWFTSVTQQLPLPDGLRQYAEETAVEQAAMIRQLLNVHGLLGWIELVMLMCVATGVSEELIFRGALRRVFEGDRQVKGRRVWIAVIVGLIFSLVHLDVYGFVVRWMLGAGLMLLVYWSGTIWPSVLAHAMNNFFALVCMKWALDHYKDINEAPTIYSMTGAWSVWVSALASAAVIWWMWRDYSAKTSKVAMMP